MRTAITCGALALSVMMAGAAEVDTGERKLRTYWLQGFVVH